MIPFPGLFALLLAVLPEWPVLVAYAPRLLQGAFASLADWAQISGFDHSISLISEHLWIYDVFYHFSSWISTLEKEFPQKLDCVLHFVVDHSCCVAFVFFSKLYFTFITKSKNAEQSMATLHTFAKLVHTHSKSTTTRSQTRMFSTMWVWSTLVPLNKHHIPNMVLRLSTGVQTGSGMVDESKCLLKSLKKLEFWKRTGCSKCDPWTQQGFDARLGSPLTCWALSVQLTGWFQLYALPRHSI